MKIHIQMEAGSKDRQYSQPKKAKYVLEVKGMHGSAYFVNYISRRKRP